MARSPFPKVEFGVLIERFVRKQASIDELQKHEQFHKELKGFCKMYDFRRFNGAYGFEDLYQDAFMKVMKSAKTLQIPGNILGELGFRKWLFVVVRTTFLSKYKQLNRPWVLDLTPCEEPEAELVVGASYADFDGNYYFNLFMDFIKSYPEKRQNAIKLNFMGYSLRETMKLLNAAGGPEVSYGTVGNWVNASIKAFEESLEARRQKMLYHGETGT